VWVWPGPIGSQHDQGRQWQHREHDHHGRARLPGHRLCRRLLRGRPLGPQRRLLHGWPGTTVAFARAGGSVFSLLALLTTPTGPNGRCSDRRVRANTTNPWPAIALARAATSSRCVGGLKACRCAHHRIPWHPWHAGACGPLRCARQRHPMGSRSGSRPVALGVCAGPAKEEHLTLPLAPPGEPYAADAKVQSYNFRLCVTQNKSNKVRRPYTHTHTHSRTHRPPYSTGDAPLRSWALSSPPVDNLGAVCRCRSPNLRTMTLRSGSSPAGTSLSV
jgi:hypothetical protein